MLVEIDFLRPLSEKVLAREWIWIKGGRGFFVEVKLKKNASVLPNLLCFGALWGWMSKKIERTQHPSQGVRKNDHPTQLNSKQHTWNSIMEANKDCSSTRNDKYQFFQVAASKHSDIIRNTDDNTREANKDHLLGYIDKQVCSRDNVKTFWQNWR